MALSKENSNTALFQPPSIENLEWHDETQYRESGAPLHNEISEIGGQNHAPKSVLFNTWPEYPHDEIEAVRKTLASGQVNYWTGQEGRCFEKEFAHYCKTEYAIALANGTVALELALRLIELKPGDEVIVTCRTFLASASTVIMAGGIPIFADVDPDSQNITAETVRAVLTSRTRAIIAVHLAGWPCEMDPLIELANEHNLIVIEDCAQAHGASYKGRPVGGLGHMAAWSFCQDKIMTTGGEGGMLTTNDRNLWEQAWAFKDHGKSYQTVYNKSHPAGFRWLHESFGTNWRMTEMQAAIGRVQIRKMDGWHESRKKNAEKILHICSEFYDVLRTPRPPEYIEHAWYKCYSFIQEENLKPGWTRDRIMQEINNRGVPCSTGSCSEVYLEKAFDQSGLRPKNRLPAARQLGDTSLMFLVHPTLTSQAIQATCSAIRDVLEQARAD